MPDHVPPPVGWLIGMTEDSRTGRLGLVARRLSDPRGLDAIRINWQSSGDPREIAARLHELANALEHEANDVPSENNTYRP